MAVEQDNLFTILQDEIFYIDNLSSHNLTLPAGVGFNAMLHCKRGSVEAKLADGRIITIRENRLLLIPAYRIARILTVSTGFEGCMLFVSDKMLKLLLGNQINVWNQAMYLDESYLIEGNDWTKEIGHYTQTLFMERHLHLHREIVLSYMRTLLLIFCEALIKKSGLKSQEFTNRATSHEKVIFNQFLTLLSSEKHHRLSVATCATELHITAKYLSAICKNVSGKSPSKWIAENVMEECCSLLRDSNLSIKEISNQLGFPNSSFFGQFFRKQAGMTPMEYRNKRKGSM